MVRSLSVDTLVVTPTLGDRLSLLNTINSVQSVGGHRVCHVVVGPIANLSLIKEQCPWIVLLDDSSKSGVYSALNHALVIHGKKFKYFAYLNDDDLWLPDFSRLFDLIDLIPSVDLCYGRTIFTSDSVPSKNGAFFPFPRSFVHLLKFGIPLFTQQSVLVKTSLILEAGLFDLSFPLSADTRLWLKLINAGATVKGVNCFSSCYELDGNRLSLDKDLNTSEKSQTILEGTLSSRYEIMDFIFLAAYRAFNLPIYLNRLLGRTAL